MDPFLSKLLPSFIYPLGLACVLIGFALVLAKRKELQRFALILALLVLWLASNRWIALGLARSLEQRYLPPTEIPPAEVVVLLGGGTLPAESPRQMVEVNGSGDRVLYAAWLYRQGKVEHILLSGGLLDWETGKSAPAQDMASLLELMDIPSGALWLQTESRNTYEDAVYCARLLKSKGVRNVLLVTSAWHMPRAVFFFRSQGVEVVPLPVDFTVTEAGWRQLTHGDLRTQFLAVIPSADNLGLTTRMLKEYLGLFVYHTWLSSTKGLK
jgi:uncharacterized SAM-binding protein YcdF (DUF218 family)